MIQLFKSKPSLADGEKARLEFHMQQLAESVGSERLQLPVLKWQDILYSGTDSSELRTVEEITNFVGEHLSHDAGNISLYETDKPVEKCGSGGG